MITKVGIVFNGFMRDSCKHTYLSDFDIHSSATENACLEEEEGVIA